MCGPIACYTVQQSGLKLYHFGRLVSYSILGVLAGYIGQIFLRSQIESLRTVSILLFVFFLLASGVAQLKGRHFPLPRFAIQAFQQMQKLGAGKSALMIGLLTGLLPCGWLYTYVLAAASTQSPWAGLIVMVLFWMGSLPTLLAVPVMIRKSLQKSQGWHQKIAAILLFIAAFYALAAHFSFN